MLILPCTCECHHYCHTCGRKLIGPNDLHINCADTLDQGGDRWGQATYTAPDPLEPWPTNEPPETFKDFEREGYGDHTPDA